MSVSPPASVGIALPYPTDHRAEGERNGNPGRSPWLSAAIGGMFVAFSTCLASVALAAGPQQAGQSDAGRCIQPATEFHKVNPDVLRAILKIESNMRADAVTRNSNGSLDVGIAQTNSIHFQELARHQIAPAHLLDACVSTYVAAWQLSKIVAKHGNNWAAIARYHSATPSHNYRYQVLLRNELVRSGVIGGKIEPVPSISKNTTVQVSKAGNQATKEDKQPAQSSTIRTDRGFFGAPLVVMDGS